MKKTTKTPIPSVQSGLQEYVKPGVSLQDVTKLKECFDIFDSDKSGQVSPSQLKNAIIALGLESQATKILTMVQNYMKNNKSQQLDFNAFMDLFGFNCDLKSQKSQQFIFQKFDVDKKGYVTFQDFKRVSEMLGERYSQNELRQMVEHADKDKDGCLSFEEFQAVLGKQYPSF